VCGPAKQFWALGCSCFKLGAGRHGRAGPSLLHTVGYLVGYLVGCLVGAQLHARERKLVCAEGFGRGFEAVWPQKSLRKRCSGLASEESKEEV